MRGIPRFIQTPTDMNNLFSLAQSEEIDKGQLAEKLKALLAKQYFHIPIISISGNVVKTHYFYEVNAGGTTIDGLTVTAVQHITPPEDVDPDNPDPTPTETEITLSAAPASGAKMLEIYMPDNFITQNGFDVNQINYILGVLANA